MGLYPSTRLSADDASLNPNLILEGNIIVIPIDMSSVLMTSIDMKQLSDTQDYSLRAWLSVFPEGIAIPSNVFASGIYPIEREAEFPMVVYVNGQTPPEQSCASLVTPGQYFLNVLNLTNQQNVFSFRKTDFYDLSC